MKAIIRIKWEYICRLYHKANQSSLNAVSEDMIINFLVIHNAFKTKGRCSNIICKEKSNLIRQIKDKIASDTEKLFH